MILAVGGGKGGVGKSVLAANLAVCLANLGHRTYAVDADLGGANLDAILGCERPSRTLCDFFRRSVSQLSDLAEPTGVEGLSLIAGDADTLGAANPAHAQKLKLIRHLRSLPGEYVVLDLGAGTTFNTLDLYLAADVGLAVTSPEPTAVQNCFGFIKSACLRDLERRTGVKRRTTQSSLRKVGNESPEARASLHRTTRLIVNRAQASEARRVTNLLHDLAGRFLGGCVQLRAAVHEDPAVAASIRRLKPVTILSPSCRASMDIMTLARSIHDPESCRVPPSEAGVNEEIVVAGVRFHLQTEDLGADQAAIRTQIFRPDGSVAYSRRTPYIDDFFGRLQGSQAHRVRAHHVAIRKAIQLGRVPLERRSA